MNDSDKVVIIISLLLIVFLPIIAHAELPFYMGFNYKGYDVDLFVVEELPTWCHSVAACALYGYLDGEVVNTIVIKHQYLNTKGVWGYSVLYHELKHIECQCDWHERMRMV